MTLKNIQNWFHGLTAPKTQEYVLIDGDQGFSPKAIHKLISFNSAVKCIWVQNKRALLSKVVDHRSGQSNLKIVRPSDIGKESVDTFIAMELVRICSQEKPKNIIIVSSDLDFVDVLINGALMFPKVKFVLMIHRCNQLTKKLEIPEIPSNGSIVYFKIKT